MTARPEIDIDDLGSWREAAACAESPVDFFPTAEDVKGISEAKAVCATCPVADECLTFALETRQAEGIWGGHTPKERQKIRRKWAEQVRRAS
jgi:WhiB family redox-sensing transcriptional regulator